MSDDGWDELIGVDADEIITQARQREIDLDLTASANDHRSVINMLRHDYTNYDGGVRNTSTDRLYGEILDAIARDFPWLAAQCETDKATHFGRLSIGLQSRRYAHTAAVDKQRAAREAIKTLVVGDKVTVKWHGRREAQVVEVRRTRIKAAFPLDDGTIHTIDRSADEVTTGGGR